MLTSRILAQRRAPAALVLGALIAAITALLVGFRRSDLRRQPQRALLRRSAFAAATPFRFTPRAFWSCNCPRMPSRSSNRITTGTTKPVNGRNPAKPAPHQVRLPVRAGAKGIRATDPTKIDEIGPRIAASLRTQERRRSMPTTRTPIRQRDRELVAWSAELKTRLTDKIGESRREGGGPAASAEGWPRRTSSNGHASVKDDGVDVIASRRWRRQGVWHLTRGSQEGLQSTMERCNTKDYGCSAMS